MSNSIQRVAVFSTYQRLSHWLLGIGILFELVSAWLIQNSNVDIIAWSDWHSMVGQVLLLLLAFRLILFFVAGSGHWRLFIPTREQRHVAIQTLKFYASLGRLPCPDWYAYNPLWQPVYLVMYLLMLACVVTGLFSGSYVFLFGASISDLHGTFSSILLYLVLAHTAFAFLHDVKGNGAQISAMLNGYKYFHSKDSTAPIEQNSVSLHSLLKK